MDDPNRTRREAEWVDDVRAGDEAAFEQMFDAYYARLCGFAAGIVGTKTAGREVVHDVFLKIWQRRADWEVHRSLKAYLYQATRNQALNYVDRRRRRRAVEQTMEEPRRPIRSTRRTAEDDVRLEELAEAIWTAIESLPERRRTTFVLHRQHDMTYAEVAEVMGVSKKTVEHQMGHALKALRKSVPLELL